MQRKTLGFLATLCPLIALAATPSMLCAAETRHPNIICVIVDQLRYQACGYAGEWKARTPNLDKLAAVGVSFRQAVSSTPVCSAFRASFLTGKYTSSTGMVINELRMNTHHRCLAQCLTQAGYQTGFIGKWHLYANQLGNHLDPKNSFVPRGPDRLGFDGYWAGYNFHDTYYNAYYHTESPEKIFYGPGVYEPNAQTTLAIDYLRAASKRKQPFFLVLSMAAPHPPWHKNDAPQQYYDLFEDVAFPPPENYSERLDPYGDRWSNQSNRPKSLEERTEWMRVYYAMIANIDWNLGRLTAAIDKAGLGEQTILLFTADHGEMFGAHGRMMKNIFYEEAVRVPFLLRWPGTIPGRTVSDACLGSADIMPTLLGLAGVPIPQEVEGADLSHCALGRPGAEPPFAFLMNTGACAAWENGHEWRALRTKRYTYAVYRGWQEKHLPRKELLFDNVADPYQMKNLAELPGHASVLADFRRKLTDKMVSLHDTFPESTWYEKNWIENRIIKRTAMLP